MNFLKNDTPANHRRAALALHALSAADRDWILERLAEPQRQLLQPLLAELKGLGFPAEAGFVRQAIGAVSAVPADDRLPVEALRQVMQTEPEPVRSLLMTVLPQAQRAMLMSQDMAVVTPAQDHPVAPALRHALESALRRRAASGREQP